MKEVRFKFINKFIAKYELTAKRQNVKWKDYFKHNY